MHRLESTRLLSIERNGKMQRGFETTELPSAGIIRVECWWQRVEDVRDAT